jgi:hypothetical protein
MLIAPGPSGQALDFFAYNAANQVWNGEAYVAWANAAYATYRIPAVETGASGAFTATAPAGMTRFELRLRGASLAASPIVWTESVLDVVAALTAYDVAKVSDVRMPSSSGTGNEAFNPRIVNDNGDPVVNASVTVKLGTTTMARGLTDATGRVRFGESYGFALPGGTYQVLIYAGGYQSSAQHTVTLPISVPPEYSLTRNTVPESPTPGMVFLDVALRNGKKPVAGEAVTVYMTEEGDVALDGAYEVKKQYSNITGPNGIARIEIFSSEKLKAAGYEGLLRVEATGANRTVWVSESGGVLDELPETDPALESP